MKKIITAILVLMLLLISGTTALAKDNGKVTGFDASGYNYNAGIYKGFAFPNVQLIMKWSKDWSFRESDPPGAYCTYQYSWYSNDYSAETRFGMLTMTTFGEG